jgi:hypothetical protein
MKYYKTNINSNIIISDYNCRLFKNNIKPYGKMDGSDQLINSLLKNTYSYHGLLKKLIKNASYGQILFHSKINTNETLVELDVNSLYACAMTKLYAVKGKSKIIEDINDIDFLLIHSTEFIIEVDIISINEKHWSRFKKDNRYVRDDITYYDLFVYQEAKLKIIRGIYWDEGTNDNDYIISDLFVRKYNTDDDNEIKNIKNDINYIHGLFEMKDKVKIYIKSKNELNSFLEFHEPILFGNYKRKIDNNYNVHLRKTIDLNYINVL